MFNFTDNTRPPTVDVNTNAPSYTEFDILTENEFGELVDGAVALRDAKKKLEDDIKDRDLDLMSLMAALPVKSVSTLTHLVTFIDSGETRTLDKNKLKAKLLNHGLDADAIAQIFEEATKVSQRKACIRIASLTREEKDEE